MCPPPTHPPARPPPPPADDLPQRPVWLPVPTDHHEVGHRLHRRPLSHPHLHVPVGEAPCPSPPRAGAPWQLSGRVPPCRACTLHPSCACPARGLQGAGSDCCTGAWLPRACHITRTTPAFPLTSPSLPTPRRPLLCSPATSTAGASARRTKCLPGRRACRWGAQAQGLRRIAFLPDPCWIARSKAQAGAPTNCHPPTAFLLTTVPLCPHPPTPRVGLPAAHVLHRRALDAAAQAADPEEAARGAQPAQRLVRPAAARRQRLPLPALHGWVGCLRRRYSGGRERSITFTRAGTAPRWWGAEARLG